MIDFVIPKAEKNKLATQFFNRVLQILNENEIKFNEKVVAELINTHFPDWRKVLNELQRYSVSGEIDAGILVNLGDKNIKDLMAMMKKKEFTNVRKWVVDSLDNDSDKLFRAVYDNLYDYIDPSSIPHVVVALGEYQYKAAFVADLEINMMACLTEIMGGQSLNDTDDGDFTMIYYPRLDWKRDAWGGGTLIDGQLVPYKGNRLVVFDAYLEHKAMPVSRECYELRNVVVFKCNVKDANRDRLDFYKEN